jgi:PEP-CTERM motif
MKRVSKILLRTTIAAFGLGMVGSAQASILYTFQGSVFSPGEDILHTIAWTYLSPDFATTGRLLQPGDLASCAADKYVNGTPQSLACGTQGLAPFVDQNGVEYSYVNFGIVDPSDPGAGVVGFPLFLGNIFAQAGQYVSGNGGSGGQGTLTVSIAEAPEPASWALMLVGFGFAGGAMRRRAKVSFA